MVIKQLFRLFFLETLEGRRHNAYSDYTGSLSDEEIYGVQRYLQRLRALR